MRRSMLNAASKGGEEHLGALQVHDLLEIQSQLPTLNATLLEEFDAEVCHVNLRLIAH